MITSDKMLDEHPESDNGQGDSDGEQEMDENGNLVSKSKSVLEADRQKMKDEMKEALQMPHRRRVVLVMFLPQGIKRDLLNSGHNQT